jgi:hypothetical protein
MAAAGAGSAGKSICGAGVAPPSSQSCRSGQVSRSPTRVGPQKGRISRRTERRGRKVWLELRPLSVQSHIFNSVYVKKQRCASRSHNALASDHHMKKNDSVINGHVYVNQTNTSPHKQDTRLPGSISDSSSPDSAAPPWAPQGTSAGAPWASQ